MSEREKLVGLLVNAVFEELWINRRLSKETMDELHAGRDDLFCELKSVICKHMEPIPFDDMMRLWASVELGKNARDKTRYGEFTELQMEMHREADSLIKEGISHPWERIRVYRSEKKKPAGEPGWDRRKFIRQHETAWPRLLEVLRNYRLANASLPGMLERSDFDLYKEIRSNPDALNQILNIRLEAGLTVSQRTAMLDPKMWE